MLFMLSQAPAEIQENKTYNVKANLERLRSEYGDDISFNGRISNFKRSVKERMFSMLMACMDKQRAPLFGAFKLTVGDVKELYEREKPDAEEREDGTKEKELDSVASKVFISYITVSELSESDKKFQRLGTSSAFERLFDERDDGDMIWVFFFNYNGGHKYLKSKGKRKQVNTVLLQDGNATDILVRLLQYGKTASHTFYDDDIYQYSKQKSLPDATRELIERVCTGGNE
jgi:hypothetical protein